MKEKISISVDTELLKRVDSFIDNTKIYNRSQAFEHLVRKALQKEITKAVILAGGEKDKLKSGRTFKPLVKVDDEEIIVHTIKVLSRYGVTDIIICAGSSKDEIYKLVANGEKFNTRISYIEDENTGTSGAIKKARKYLKNDFFVIYGDIYFDFDLGKMMNFHNMGSDLVTLAIATTRLQESKDRVEIEGSKVVKFDYIPRERTYVVNAGVCIFSPGIFAFLPNKGSLEKDVFPELAGKGKINAYNFMGKWKHIG